VAFWPKVLGKQLLAPRQILGCCKIVRKFFCWKTFVQNAKFGAEKKLILG